MDISYLVLLVIGCIGGCIFAIPALSSRIKLSVQRHPSARRLICTGFGVVTFIIMFPFLSSLAVFFNQIVCWEGGNSYCDTYINYEEPIIEENFTKELTLQTMIPVNFRGNYCFSEYDIVCDTVDEYTNNIDANVQFGVIILSTLASIFCCVWIVLQLTRNNRKYKKQ